MKSWRNVLALISVSAVITAVLLWLNQPARPVDVPSDAAKLALSGTGEVTVYPDPKGALYAGSGKALQICKPATLKLPDARQYRFTGSVTLRVRNGEVVAAVNDTIVVEPPDRDYTAAIVLTDNGTVKIAGAAPDPYRIARAHLLIANESSRATCIDCQNIEVHGRAEVTATRGGTATVNMTGRLKATGTKKVIARDKAFVELADVEEVMVGGTAKAEATRCKRLVAENEAKVKVSQCGDVELRDKARKVLFFILR